MCDMRRSDNERGERAAVILQANAVSYRAYTAEAKVGDGGLG